MGERIKWVPLAPVVEPGRVQLARRVLELGLRRGLLQMTGVQENQGRKEERETREAPPPSHPEQGN